jgi:L-lactate utilization protein LutB
VTQQEGCAVDEVRERELEQMIAELKGRWPKHSVPPLLWEELEELERLLEEARAAGSEERDGRQAGLGRLP